MEAQFTNYTKRDGMERTANKLFFGQEMTIAFIGGSVTEGAGASVGEQTSYRALICRYFGQQYPETVFHFINAAIGGTDSVYGAFRLKEHVLNLGPIDLLFVEFAVNDSGDLTDSIRAMEGIVRQTKRLNPQTDICFLYAANRAGLNQYFTDGRVQNNIYHHEKVAEYYGIPSVSIAEAIYSRIKSNTLKWEEISADEVHPNDCGYALYAKFIQEFLHILLQPINDAQSLAAPNLPQPMDSFCYEKAELLSPHKAEGIVGWDKLNNWTFEHVCYWKLPEEVLLGETAGASFQFRFSGTAVGFTMLAGMDLGDVDCSIDGDVYRTFKLFDRNCALFYRPKIIVIADTLAAGSYIVNIRISSHKDELSAGYVIRILNFLVSG